MNDAVSGDGEACKGCGRVTSCAPLWAEQRKYCPDCTCAPLSPAEVERVERHARFQRWLTETRKQLRAKEGRP